MLQQGLIEPIGSDWACQVFYVEERFELVHGKKRLVIDYQPLNTFLKDDKFPLQKIQTLFVYLQGARIFSKFDLKAGFWQLGIRAWPLARVGSVNDKHLSHIACGDGSWPVYKC